MPLLPADTRASIAVDLGGGELQSFPLALG
jgi:hypothetical protein